MKRKPVFSAGHLLCSLFFLSPLVSQDKKQLTSQREAIFQEWQKAIQEKSHETAAAKQVELLEFERELYRLSQSDESMDEKVYAGSLIYSLNGVASGYSAKNRHRESARLYAEAHDVMSRFLPSGHWQLTDAALKRQKEEKKIELSPPQLTSLNQTYGSMQKARSLYARGKLKEALPLVQSSLRTRVELLGEAFPETAECFAYLGLIHKYSGDFEEAEKIYRKAFRICEDHLGHHPNTARMCTNLGKLYQETRNFVAAEPLLRRAHSIKKSIRGAAHQDTTASLNALAELYDAIGDRDRRESVLVELLPLRKQAMGENHISVAAIHSNLGLLYKQKGEFDRSEANFTDALAIWQRQGASDDPKAAYGSTLNNLGELYRVMGEYDKAEGFLLRAIRDKKAKLGPSHVETAMVINNLGNVYFDKGDIESAEKAYREALGLKSESGFTSAPSSAISLDNIGAIHFRKGDYRKAAEHCERAFEIRKKHLGDHLDTARSLNNLGLIFSAMDRTENGITLLEESCRMMERLHGKAHPQRVSFLHNLARIQRRAGLRREAISTLDECRRTASEHISRILPGLPENRQLKFLEMRDRPSLDFALSMVFDSPAPSRLELETSADWVLNGKAKVVEAIASRNRLSSSSSEEARRLELTRTRFAALSLKKPEDLSNAEYRKQLSELEVSETRLTAAIGMDLSPVSPLWVTHDAVRDRLSASSVLIEMIRFRKHSFDRPGKKAIPHYGAWIIGKQEAIAIVDLGPAGIIDDSIATLRKQLSGSPKKLVEIGERAAYDELSAALEKVARFCLLPLLEEVGEASRLVFSPDSNLWLIPWSALTLADGRFAVEAYEIDLVVSGRSLATPVDQEVRGSPSVVFADPDFDLSSDIPDEGASHSNGNRGPIESLPDFPRLPGTEREARSILQSLEGFSNTAPIGLLNVAATESAFKSLANPEMLVFSTHGFFLPGDLDHFSPPISGILSLAREEVEDESPSAVTNPLLRCGLTLAGCNRDGENGEDGILTGLEITSRDLRGTRLVVLSACETGLGEVRNGEGVAGLRQAFQIAGAGDVLSTLWQIPDQETADLMSRFFEEFSRGNNTSASLRAAQLDQIRNRKLEKGVAHPYFWGAFNATTR